MYGKRNRFVRRKYSPRRKRRGKPTYRRYQRSRATVLFGKTLKRWRPALKIRLRHRAARAREEQQQQALEAMGRPDYSILGLLGAGAGALAQEFGRAQLARAVRFAGFDMQGGRIGRRVGGRGRDEDRLMRDEEL